MILNLLLLRILYNKNYMKKYKIDFHKIKAYFYKTNE